MRRSLRTYKKLAPLAHRKGYHLEETQHTMSLWTLRQRRWPGREYRLQHSDGSEVKEGPTSTSLRDVRTWLLTQPDAYPTANGEAPRSRRRVKTRERVKWRRGGL